jgi:hypothetical protein
MATSSYDVGRAGTEEYDVTGGGWITFAAILLGLAGTFNVLEGILAIANSRVYTAHQTFVFSDLRTWGWIVLFLGVFQLLAAFSLFGGQRDRALVRGLRRGRQCDRAAVLRPCFSDLVAADVLHRHPDHLRTRGLRRAPAARRLTDSSS